MIRCGQDTLKAVARARHLDVIGIVGPSRCKWYVHARIEIARTLYAAGYSPSLIARILHRDHTTVLYYLERLARKPPPTPSKDYLKPYAGAYMPEYEWIEKPQGNIRCAARQQPGFST